MPLLCWLEQFSLFLRVQETHCFNRGRGGDDPHMSHDLGDVISVIAGRPDCVDEVRAAGAELAGWLGSQMADVFPPDSRIELVAGHLSPTAPVGLAEIAATRISGLVGLAQAS